MRRLAYALIALTAGCGNIGSPQITSTDVYSYTNTDAGTPVTFRWPRSALPVRVWVAPDSPIRANVDTAIARWQDAFLYGEFRATIVTDSNVADVIVRNTPSDIGGGLNRRASQCVGETDQDIDPTAHTLTLPVHVFMYAVVSDVIPGLAQCYNITMTHEFGHVLGLIVHSPSSGDVMFSNPLLNGISEHDRLTVITLYSITPTISISGRR